MRRARALALATAGAAVGLLALAAPASAHVTVISPDATQGGYAVLTFRVPTESATASTTKLQVQLPTDTPFASVGVQPLAGWTESTAMTKLAKPITTDDGDEISSAVSTVTWTAQAGNAIAPGHFQQFYLQVGALPDAPSITFKALQTYSDGSVVRWIETPAPGSSVEPDHPAPTLMLPAASTTTAPVTTHAAVVEKQSNTTPTVLAIIALVVAVLAVGYAFVTRSRARKGSTG
jgi:periplasmic copper chaperone A